MVPQEPAVLQPCVVAEVSGGGILVGPAAAPARGRPTTRHLTESERMGKGDQRTEKGKRVRGTHGKSRPKNGKKSAVAAPKPTKKK